MNEGQVPPPIPPATPPPPTPPPPTPPPPTDFQYARSQVSAPAIGLLVVAILDIVAGLISVLISFIGVGLIPFLSRSRVYDQLPDMLEGAVGGSFAIVGLAVSGFVVYAALKMRELKQWELCIAASILYCIPCLSACCIIGIPFGIWSLIVLMKPEIKEAFQKMT